jgi:hypothetical protein
MSIDILPAAAEEAEEAEEAEKAEEAEEAEEAASDKVDKADTCVASNAFNIEPKPSATNADRGRHWSLSEPKPRHRI